MFEFSFETFGLVENTYVLKCHPIVPGSVTIRIEYNFDDVMIITDDGNGLLVGDGFGSIKYDTGVASFTLDHGVNSGIPILANYESVEGGCYNDCGKCATHFLKLEILPSTISGSSEFTLNDAWERLFIKLNRDIKPIHVEFLFETISEDFFLSVSPRFDIINSDVISLDIETTDYRKGLHVIFDNPAW